ncbi:MAG: hypothetical protein K0R39_2434 [Symbiobacteriaceae bacterium]|nr:hypothetical protein [Symbiobacteriaceae bacterium]
MPNIDKSAPGGRESSQENIKKPGHGANATKNNHGQQGQAQQDHMVMNQGAHSFKHGQE